MACCGLKSIKHDAEDEKQEVVIGKLAGPPHGVKAPEKTPGKTGRSISNEETTPGSASGQKHTASTFESGLLDQTNADSTLESERVFQQFDLLNIVQLGSSEGWLISPSSLSLVDTPLKHGGYGSVRQATLDGKTVAVKLPHHADAETAKAHALKRTKCICATVLANELRVFRSLEHPNIVKFLGATGLYFGEGQDRWPELAVLLEWVDGGSLNSYVKSMIQEANFAPRALLHDVARGLAYLHRQKDADDVPILHRDLKPHNILITTSKPPSAKICDFGLSVLMMKNCDVTIKAGTTRYMAPEVSSGKAYNVAADVFSFGCVCFFAMTGRHPEKTVRGDLQELRVVDAMSSVQKIGVQCLDAEPSSRPCAHEVWANFEQADSSRLGQHSQSETRLTL